MFNIYGVTYLLGRLIRKLIYENMNKFYIRQRRVYMILNYYYYYYESLPLKEKKK